MLVNMPLERIPMRYSSDWDDWFSAAFKKEFKDKVVTVKANHDLEYKTIQRGQFLDVVGTNRYKLAQMGKLLELVQSGKVGDGDVIFVHDLWFSGLEALFYVRDGLGVDIKIVGCLHAGSYDSQDFLAKKGMGRWARELETSWFNEVDHIIVATQYHKQLLTEQEQPRVRDPSKVSVVGFWPVLLDDLHMLCGNCIVRYKAFYQEAKVRTFCFPHRLAHEKGVELLPKLEEAVLSKFGDKMVATHTVSKTKEEFYDHLNSSSIAVSLARQETFGIAQVEAAMFGCIPIVPDYLSYKELFPECFQYDHTALETGDLSQVIYLYGRVRKELLGESDPELLTQFIHMRQNFINKSKEAIPSIVRIIKGVQHGVL